MSLAWDFMHHAWPQWGANKAASRQGLWKEDGPLLTSCFLEEKLSSEFASSPSLMLSSELTVL